MSKPNHTSEFEIDPERLALTVLNNLNLSASVAYLVIDHQNWSIIYASPNLARLLPDTPDQPQKQPFTDIIWELAGFESHLTALIDQPEETFRLDKMNRTHNGELLYYNMQVKAMPITHLPHHLLCILEDVTDAVRTEQQLVQQRNELELAQAKLVATNDALQHLTQLKTLMLSMVAHDMRSPLSAMRGYSELLLNPKSVISAEEKTEFLSAIWSQTIWMDKLISNLLDLDRIERGTLLLDTEPCDLVDLITDTIDSLIPTLKLANLTIHFKRPQEEYLIAGDTPRLQQILYNLLNNAIKYTPAGGEIFILLAQTLNQIECHIKDTGPGIPFDEQATLFDAYQRTSQSEKSTIVGSGLGLYIVKMLVEAHNGEVTVDSSEGEGTTFSLYFPPYQDEIIWLE
ncbi:MAG TPA: PAS domain-containing sensor histidine kinase [Anaerolineae bacterium]|nr:PAS domain-containing sensor histidine kinase [Anaerolineae bacterium]